MKKRIIVLLIAIITTLSGCSATTDDSDPIVDVVELGSTSTTNDMGFTEITDKYHVEFGDEDYTLISSARLKNESASLRTFKASHAEALQRMAELTGIADLTESNAKQYADAVIPILTAYEHNGEAISLEDQQYASLVLGMSLLLTGDDSAEEFKSALADLSSDNLTDAETASAIELLSANAPAVAGDNADFVRAIQDTYQRAE